MATIDPYVLKHLSHMQPALYWLDEDPLEPQPNPTLIGDVTTDLCVVGAGYTGLWTALIAKEHANAFLIGLGASLDGDAVGKLAAFRAKVQMAEEAQKRITVATLRTQEAFATSTD